MTTNRSQQMTSTAIISTHPSFKKHGEIPKLQITIPEDVSSSPDELGEDRALSLYLIRLERIKRKYPYVNDFELAITFFNLNNGKESASPNGKKGVHANIKSKSSCVNEHWLVQPITPIAVKEVTDPVESCCATR